MGQAESEVTGWCSYRPLLRMALDATDSEVVTGCSGGPVLELGCGDGSTAWLDKICEEQNRKLFSLDHKPEYIIPYAHLRSPRHRIELAETWDRLEVERPPSEWGDRWSVALVDHAPGERRIVDIRRLADKCDILVIHDTQHGQARAGYGYDAIWSLFKYIKHDDRLPEWATAVSNFVDVTKWELS